MLKHASLCVLQRVAAQVEEVLENQGVFSLAIVARVQGVCRNATPGDWGKKPFKTGVRTLTRSGLWPF